MNSVRNIVDPASSLKAVYREIDKIVSVKVICLVFEEIETKLIFITDEVNASILNPIEE
jgi:hypothetical protein